MRFNPTGSGVLVLVCGEVRAVYRPEQLQGLRDVRLLVCGDLASGPMLDEIGFLRASGRLRGLECERP